MLLYLENKTLFLIYKDFKSFSMKFYNRFKNKKLHGKAR